MVSIKEIEPISIPGATSLLIQFPYNQEYISFLKGLSPHKYHKNTKEWELPITYLSEILDKFIIYEDIDLELLETKAIDYKSIQLPEFKTKPYSYQLDGIRYGLTHDSWLLLDEAGLGKTIEIIYIAQELKRRRNIRHCLIVCGVNTLKYNWKKEIARHSDLDCVILGERINRRGKSVIGSVQDRINHLKSDIKEFFVILNIESLRSEGIINAINNGPNKFDMIIIDEIHKCVDGDSVLLTNDGYMTISDIVEGKRSVKVLSFNEQRNDIEFTDITDWHRVVYNGDIIELEFEDENNNNYTIRCSADHKIYTHNRGYVLAKDINEHDSVELLKI